VRGPTNCRPVEVPLGLARQVITSLPKSFQLSIALREPFSVDPARATSELSRIPIDTPRIKNALSATRLPNSPPALSHWPG